MVKEVVLVPVNGRRNNQSLPLLVLVLLCVRNNHFLLLLLCVHVCDSHSAAIALHKRVVHFSEGLLQIDCAHMCVCVTGLSREFAATDWVLLDRLLL